MQETKLFDIPTNINGFTPENATEKYYGVVNMKQALIESKHNEDLIQIIEVPGAFEIPSIAQKLEKKDYSAIICIGAIIKGETDHYHYICDAVSHGILRVSMNSQIPIIFGIITCQNIKYATTRSSTKDLSKNKGYEVGKSALEMIKVFNENNLS